MGILTGIKNIIQRNNIAESEQRAREDLLKTNRDLISDVSQRRGLVINSGLTASERDYILSDAIIASAIQLYLADILSICNKNSVRITSDVDIKEEDGELAKKLARAEYIFSQIYSDNLTEATGINLLNNGEIFWETTYNEGLNKASVVETSYARCTQLCYPNGETAAYVCSNDSVENNEYQYTFATTDTKADILDPDKMVRVYLPTLVNSKICIELDNNNNTENALATKTGKNYLYYTNCLSLLKQIYPDWLNGKLLELAVYRDRIAKSRAVYLIALELGRTSRITSDQIYDNVKDYFDKRAVLDLKQQTFKSVVGDEPFTDYKVYTTRNGVGQLKFDQSLNNHDLNLSSLADLDYNQTKVFAGLGIPKQYLGADDNGSALSNGGSLFFMDEKYQKRVVSYVKKIANGYKEAIKNIIIQQEGKEYFLAWDFNVEFEIPESNEEIYRVKNARLDYTSALLELVDKIEDAKSQGKTYSLDAISDLIQDDIRKFTISDNSTEE
nr:hypothetical protein DGKKSRWO_DGKKSRWO_CDS_0036 [uncultured phage]CAI9752171.1 hypothetical protein CVNMHQAP_CVNMHQAP_CDS_0036 [uncultured phage]